LSPSLAHCDQQAKIFKRQNYCQQVLSKRKTIVNTVLSPNYIHQNLLAALAQSNHYKGKRGPLQSTEASKPLSQASYIAKTHATII
jgi:hypothetical protein